MIMNIDLEGCGTTQSWVTLMCQNMAPGIEENLRDDISAEIRRNKFTNYDASVPSCVQFYTFEPP